MTVQPEQQTAIEKLRSKHKAEPEKWLVHKNKITMFVLFCCRRQQQNESLEGASGMVNDAKMDNSINLLKRAGYTLNLEKVGKVSILMAE